jgi:hypothetical protein
LDGRQVGTPRRHGGNIRADERSRILDCVLQLLRCSDCQPDKDGKRGRAEGEEAKENRAESLEDAAKEDVLNGFQRNEREAPDHA